MQVTKPRRIFDAVIVGSGASGGWVAPNPHTRLHRAHLALPVAVSRFRRPGETSRKSAHPAALLRLRRIWPPVFCQRPRKSLHISSRPTFPVDSLEAGGRKNVLLGAGKLPLQRLRIQSRQPRRLRGRLAHPVQRPRGRVRGFRPSLPLTSRPEPAPQEEMVLDRQNAHDTFGRHAEGLAHFLGPNDPPEMNHPVVHDNTQRR